MVVGSIAVGAWIARIVFVVLIVESIVQERFRVTAIAIALGLAGWFVLGRINPDLVTPYIAIVAIGLVFVVLGRDIRLN